MDSDDGFFAGPLRLPAGAEVSAAAGAGAAGAAVAAVEADVGAAEAAAAAGAACGAAGADIVPEFGTIPAFWGVF